MCVSGLVVRAWYTSAGGHRFQSFGEAHFHMDNTVCIYLDWNVLVNRCWEPAHNVYYILTKPQTVL